MNPKDGVNADAARFRSTHWGIVLTAAQDQTPAGQAALAELYRSYWYPLYAHVRRRGYNPQDAQDLTQGFFLHLLEYTARQQNCLLVKMIQKIRKIRMVRQNYKLRSFYTGLTYRII